MLTRRRGWVETLIAHQIAIGMLTCLASLLAPASATAGGRRRNVATRVRANVETRASARLAATPIEEHLHVQRGDTLGAILGARGVGPREAHAWITAAVGVYDVRRLRPTRGITLRFDRATHVLQAIRYEIDDRSLLVLEREADGHIRAARAALPYFTEVKGVAGRIERGLREDAGDSGIPPRIVSQLADIFGWDLDLGTDLRPGDEFRILYENIWETGETRPESGNVLGAQILTRGRTVTAIFFEDAEGRGGYYRPSGDALSRDFLRYPLEFTEITSEFSLLRRHPILHVQRPHLGVDFAAPRGTPVRAIAGGTVADSGWEGGLGRCVRIDHPGELESAYGHLARIAPGVTPGTVVTRGQVIGYVGATGLATGPHLHFALSRAGAYVDPLTHIGLPQAGVPELARRTFDRVRTAVIHQLALLPASASPLTVSLSDAPFRAR
jgi:murein DD-endopeptidase MepM/ murein hydrolase activator NlpD